MRSLFLFLLVFVVALPVSVRAQSAYWRVIPAPTLSTPRWVDPAEGQFLSLDLEVLRASLSKEGITEMVLPGPDGLMRPVKATWSPSAEPGFLERYPHWVSCRIFDPEDPSVSGRIDMTDKGFHALYFLEGRAVQIDPVYRDRKDLYAVYFKDAYWGEDQAPVPFQCPLQEDTDETETETPLSPGIDLRSLSAPVDLLHYRMAIATTGEYSQFHGGTKDLVLSELYTAVNRLNAVLERDMGIHLSLIADNHKLVFLDPISDGYTNGETGQMINQNPTRIANFIELEDYDIGHVFGTATNGTVGLAQLGCVCTTSKARGVSGLWTPKFDPFYINVVAHEVGHQYAATHSFNKCINESPGTGWEPGGGSTIMSYSGSCGSNSVQGNAHDYYHGGSLRQMRLFVTQDAGASCPEKIQTGNLAPEATLSVTSGFSIPVLTPFRLDVQAFDENGDALSYCWEGMDTGPITDAGDPVLTSPLFRSLPPVSSPFRVFPKMSTVLNNGYDKFEHLPHYSREMNFRVTVRDNNPEAGGYIQKDVRFHASEQAGPFRVLSFATVDTVRQGDYVPVEWEVAGTDLPPVSCRQVNIRLSVDAGATFPYLLAEGVPNTGLFHVTIPKVTASHARIMVEAADNIFFQTSRAALRILPAEGSGLMFGLAPFAQTACIPDQVSITLSMDTLGTGAGPLTLDVTNGLPPGATYWFDQPQFLPPGEVTLHVALADVTKGGTYDLEITALSGNQSSWTRPAQLRVVRSDYSSLAAVLPADGVSGVSTSPLFRWARQEDADQYRFELATHPLFGPGTVVQAEGLTDTFFQVLSTLQTNTLYYWRVIPENICGKWADPEVFAFHTLGLQCTEYTSNETVLIPSQGTFAAQTNILVPAAGNASTVWVPHLTANHNNIGHLRGTLRSPSGTTVRLFSSQCFTVAGSINMGFNDFSQQPFVCPPNLGQVYKSQEPLTAFNGEPVEGNWTMFLEDILSGSGGSLTGWTLSLCSDVTTSNPYLVRNLPLVLAPGSSAVLPVDLLLAEDLDQFPWELTYRIVQTPGKGVIRLAGVELAGGDRFTQQDIYDGLITYQDYSFQEGEDQMRFVVEDGQGGWIPIQRFVFRTEDASGTEMLHERNVPLVAFPNPARDWLQVDLQAWEDVPVEVRLVTMTGQDGLSTATARGGSIVALPVSHLPEGMYLLVARSSRHTAVTRVHITR